MNFVRVGDGETVALELFRERLDTVGGENQDAARNVVLAGALGVKAEVVAADRELGPVIRGVGRRETDDRLIESHRLFHVVDVVHRAIGLLNHEVSNEWVVGLVPNRVVFYDMKSVKAQLTALFADIFASKGLEPRFGQVTVSDRPDLADYQCNGALACAKQAKRNPREVAQEVLTAANAKFSEIWGEGSATLSIAGPGFINIVLGPDLLAKFVQGQVGDKRLGVETLPKKRKVVVDYGGPNVAKSMHVGHIRSTIIGDSIVRIHRFLGDEVLGDIHLGDWGTQMGMLICEIKRRQPDLPYFDPAKKDGYPKESPVTLADLEEIYPTASARYKEDEEFKKETLRATDELQQGRPGYKALWQHFVDATRTALTDNFGKLDVRFDLWIGESFYETRMPAMVEKLKKNGKTEISEGAVVVPLADEKNPEMPPLILVKAGGGFLYHTSDLATIEHRVEDLKVDAALYVVDARQRLHFEQVFKAARKTGLAKDIELTHLYFGTMNGTDGKPFKTRAGGVLKLKDLIDMVTDEARKRLTALGVDRTYTGPELDDIAHKVGMATLKFADLKNNRAADYVFDLEKFSQFEGHTGPYLLYATVRIKSILRKALEQGLKPGAIVAPTTASEKRLMLEFLKLPETLLTAYNEGEPHHISEYGYNLSQAFNSFYAECHILRETDPSRQGSWLALSKLCHDHLELCLGLLGITVPERM